jgi:hypothetical protein
VHSRRCAVSERAADITPQSTPGALASRRTQGLRPGVVEERLDALHARASVKTSRVRLEHATGRVLGQ